MIVYINDRLNVWSAWHASGRKVIGLSYPGQCAFSRLTPSARSNSAPIVDEEAWDTEKAIQSLDNVLKELIYEVYLKPGTMETHAKALHVCTKTMYNKLHIAHLNIMEWLQVGDDDMAMPYALKKHA
jgi:hypothetical protein